MSTDIVEDPTQDDAQDDMGAWAREPVDAVPSIVRRLPMLAVCLTATAAVYGALVDVAAAANLVEPGWRVVAGMVALMVVRALWVEAAAIERMNGVYEMTDAMRAMLRPELEKQR